MPRIASTGPVQNLKKSLRSRSLLGEPLPFGLLWTNRGRSQKHCYQQCMQTMWAPSITPSPSSCSCRTHTHAQFGVVECHCRKHTCSIRWCVQHDVLDVFGHFLQEGLCLIDGFVFDLLSYGERGDKFPPLQLVFLFVLRVLFRPFVSPTGELLD